MPLEPLIQALHLPGEPNLHWCLIDLQVTASHQIEVNQVVERLESRGCRRHLVGKWCARDFQAKTREFWLHPAQRPVLQILHQNHMGQEDRTADSRGDHLRRHLYLHRAVIFAGVLSVYRANRPVAGQMGRDEIKTLGRSFAQRALLAAAMVLGLGGGLEVLLNRFRVLGQRFAHRLLGGALLDVRNHDDIFGGGRFRLIRHFIDQRKPAILDRRLL